MTKADSENKKIYSNQHPKGKTPTGGGSDFQTSGTRIKAYGKTPKVKIEKLTTDKKIPSSFVLGPTDKPSNKKIPSGQFVLGPTELPTTYPSPSKKIKTD